MAHWAVLALIGLLILGIPPIVVRVRTGKWGNAKALADFQAARAAARNSPEHRAAREFARSRVFGILFCGLPVGVAGIWASQRLGYSTKAFMPVVMAIMLGSAELLAAFLRRRASQ